MFLPICFSSILPVILLPRTYHVNCVKLIVSLRSLRAGGVMAATPDRQTEEEKYPTVNEARKFWGSIQKNVLVFHNFYLNLNS